MSVVTRYVVRFCDCVLTFGLTQSASLQRMGNNRFDAVHDAVISVNGELGKPWYLLLRAVIVPYSHTVASLTFPFN